MIDFDGQAELHPNSRKSPYLLGIDRISQAFLAPRGDDQSDVRPMSNSLQHTPVQ